MMAKSDNIVFLSDPKSIEVQAAEWIMRFEDGRDDIEDRALFIAWRNESKQHRETVNRLAKLWDSLDILDELDYYGTADDNVALAKMEERVDWRMFSRRSFLTGVAASITLIAGIALYQTVSSLSARHHWVYQTAVGEQEKIALPDGSTIELNTNTLIRIAYTKSARDIKLEHGEVYFDVAPDRHKPFFVHAGKGVVTAVGTAFTVRMHEDKLEVTVAEGRVALSGLLETEISRRDDPLSPVDPVMEVTAGQNAIFDEKVEHIEYLEPSALNRKLSWREGVLAFSGEPLSNVIADISRYTDVTIEIRGEDLRGLPVAGYFKVGEVEAILQALELMADVKVERVSEKFVRLSWAGK